MTDLEQIRWEMLKKVKSLPPGTWISTDYVVTKIHRTANAMQPAPQGPAHEIWWRTQNLINQLYFILRNSPNPDQADVPF